jgi:phosphate butyryltransferase
VISQVEEILELARRRPAKPRVAVAGAESIPLLEVIDAAHSVGIAESILFGRRDRIVELAGRLSMDLGPYEVVDCKDAAACVQAALEHIRDGSAGILCKGTVPTRSVLKGVLNKRWGFRTERALSHLGVFNVPGENRVMIITDAGVNVQPNLSRKRDILLNAVDLAHTLGLERPRVAILSFVEEVTDRRIGSQADAEQLERMYKDGSITGCVVEGPYSLDVALSAEAARIKGVEGEVAGRADVIVMHDIGMGNILYKAMLLWCKPVIAAAVVGARIPIVSPSRADSMETKLNSIALSVMIHGRQTQQVG